jgi:hypothetical protein
MTDPRAGSVPPKPAAPAVRHLGIEYHGFRSVEDRREYLLSAKLGTESCEYTVWIPHSAFAAGHALCSASPTPGLPKTRGSESPPHARVVSARKERRTPSHSRFSSAI